MEAPDKRLVLGLHEHAAQDAGAVGVGLELGVADEQRLAPDVQDAEEDGVVGIAHSRLEHGDAGRVERGQRSRRPGGR